MYFYPTKNFASPYLTKASRYTGLRNCLISRGTFRRKKIDQQNVYIAFRIERTVFLPKTHAVHLHSNKTIDITRGKENPVAGDNDTGQEQ